jgi:hypothetical protein
MHCLQCGKYFYVFSNGFYLLDSHRTIGALCEQCSLFINKKQLFHTIMDLRSYCCIKVRWDGATYNLHSLMMDPQSRFTHAKTFIEKLRSSPHPACRKFRLHQIKLLRKIKMKISQRTIGKFLLQYIILHPTSPYVHRLANEFYSD